MRIASQLYSGPLTKTCRSQNVCLLSIQCLPLLHLTQILVSPSSMYSITSIQVARFESHLQPCNVPPPTRSKIWCLTSIQVAYVASIQVTKIAPKLHPSPIPISPGLKICSSTQSRSDLTPIHFLRFASHLNLGS